MKQQGEKLWLSDLLGCKIVTADGKALGYVRDIELSEEPEYHVKALLFGWGGIANHFHILNPFRNSDAVPKPKAIPWHQVATLKGRTIQLKPSFAAT